MKQLFFKFVLVSAAVCGSVAGAHAQNVKSLKVEILINSGLPNPSFAITDPHEIKEILATAKQLPANSQVNAEGDGLPAPRLGYNGLLVTNQSGESTELKTIHVRGPSVAVASAAPGLAKAKRLVSNRDDHRHALEDKLLTRGKQMGYINEDLSQRIESER